MTNSCNYITPDGNTKCSRPSVQYNKCLFHLSAMHSKKPNASEYYSELNNLIKAKDTSWAGFIFPENFKLYDMEFDTEIDLKWSVFEDVVINNVACNEKFDMRHSEVNGPYHISNTKFEKDADFFETKFHKNAEFNVIFSGRAGLNDCDFYGRTSFLGSFSGTGSFHKTRFHEAVTFRGGREISMIASAKMGTIKVEAVCEYNHSLPTAFSHRVKIFIFHTKNIIKSKILDLYSLLISTTLSAYNITKSQLIRLKRRFVPANDASVTLRWLFDSEIMMTEVEFRRPEGAKFMGIDMSKVSLIGTDVMGVHFDDVKFHQSALKRQGLYDEILLLNEMDYNTRTYMWPRIESEYRNVRVSMENNKNFSTATDFYVGEMEARRQQMFYPKRYVFSVEAIYHALSNYGSNPLRAIRMFLWLVILHTALTMSFVIDPELAFLKVFNNNIQNPIMLETLKTSAIYIINSLKILTLQRGDTILHMTYSSLSGHIIDTVFRILGPAQIALIILSIRAKIKRH